MRNLVEEFLQNMLETPHLLFLRHVETMEIFDLHTDKTICLGHVNISYLSVLPAIVIALRKNLT
jgi:hypothetical protein